MSRFVRHAPPDSLPGKASSSGAGGCKYFFFGVGLVALGIVILAGLGVVAYTVLGGLPSAPIAHLICRATRRRTKSRTILSVSD